VHADRLGRPAELLAGTMVEIDMGANRFGSPPMMASIKGKS
jgi:hypothetical protein